MAQSRSESEAAFLRRVAAGDLVLRTHGAKDEFCYASGHRLPPWITDNHIKRMISDKRLIPVGGEGLWLGDGEPPPQRYRARTPADGKR